jgi:hypothetical protein
MVPGRKGWEGFGRATRVRKIDAMGRHGRLVPEREVRDARPAGVTPAGATPAGRGPVASLLALQRSSGNRAVAQLLEPVAPPVVQRYQATLHNGGAIHPAAQAQRAAGGELGFTGSANLGWIVIGTAAVDQPPHFERSVAPTAVPGSGAHSEERLLAWAQAQGVNLALAPNDPGPGLRIKAMYTERHPCRANGEADHARTLRTLGCCHDDLTYALHPLVPVYYSVIGPGPHGNMLRDERARFVRQREIRRLTIAYNARVGQVGHHVGLLAVYQGARNTILGFAHPNSDFAFGNFRANVGQAANAGILAIQAWNPPPVAADDNGKDDKPKPPPPGDGSASGRSGKHDLSSSVLGGNADGGAKRVKVGT